MVYVEMLSVTCMDTKWNEWSSSQKSVNLLRIQAPNLPIAPLIFNRDQLLGGSPKCAAYEM